MFQKSQLKTKRKVNPIKSINPISNSKISSIIQGTAAVNLKSLRNV